MPPLCFANSMPPTKPWLGIMHTSSVWFGVSPTLTARSGRETHHDRRHAYPNRPRNLPAPVRRRSPTPVLAQRPRLPERTEDQVSLKTFTGFKGVCAFAEIDNVQFVILANNERQLAALWLHIMKFPIDLDACKKAILVESKLLPDKKVSSADSPAEPTSHNEQ
jgi:hypothetical protein